MKLRMENTDKVEEWGEGESRREENFDRRY